MEVISTFLLPEEETINELASGAAATCGAPFRLRFLVRFWDVSNVSRPRRCSFGETRGTTFNFEKEGWRVG